MDETMRGNRMGSMLLSAVMIVSFACFSASSQPLRVSIVIICSIFDLITKNMIQLWTFSVVALNMKHLSKISCGIC